jgi:hypothetical protein
MNAFQKVGAADLACLKASCRAALFCGAGSARITTTTK